MRRPFGEIDVDFIGRDAFVRNKRATGRTKDLADVEGLGSDDSEGGCLRASWRPS
jgi:hypothetical protein